MIIRTITKKVLLLKNWSYRLQSSLIQSNKVCVISTITRGIGLEFAKQLLNNDKNIKIIGLGRDINNIQSSSIIELKDIYKERLILIPVDLESIESIVNASIEIKKNVNHIDLLLNVAGILGDGKNDNGPERSFEQLDINWLTKSLNVNLIGHMMMTKNLLSLLKQNKNIESKVINLSARIGSISDNKLGGWYSYRISKAALNQFTKTFSIEMKKFNISCISIHPGTTETDLSLPFRKNMNKDKLFSVSYSVSKMLNVINNININNTGSFYAYDGTNIEW